MGNIDWYLADVNSTPKIAPLCIKHFVGLDISIGNVLESFHDHIILLRTSQIDCFRRNGMQVLGLLLDSRMIYENDNLKQQLKIPELCRDPF